MIDVHCHLTEEPLYTQLKMVVEEARQAGVAAIITSGIGYEDCVRVLEISDNTYIYPTLGIEPYELTGYEMVLDLIVKNRDRVAGVGEVGLDYYIGC
jgi:TatD DNase family protein